MLLQLLQNQQTFIQNQQSSINKLEAQMERLLSIRQPGTLPGNTEENPKGDYAELKTITTRSGKQVNPIPTIVKPPVAVPPKLVDEDEEVIGDESPNVGEDGANGAEEEMVSHPVGKG